MAVEEYLQQQITEAELKLGFPICGARNRLGGPCKNISGKRTDHLREGRCYLHGGMNQSPLSASWKHGRLSKVKTLHPMLKEKMEQIAQDHQVFDLEEEIIKLRAIMEILSEKEDWLSVAKLALDVSKVVERLHNIQVGRKYVISIENVGVIIETVKDTIFRHVPDEYTRHLIATDLNNARLSTGAPSPKLIEAEYRVVDEGD